MARKRLSGPRADFLTESPEAGKEETVLKPARVLGAGGPPIAQVAAQAATENAFRELADDVAKARAEGRMVLEIPRDQIAPDHLARDRVVQDNDELQSLVESIRAHGQRTPIEVTELGGAGQGSYGLISGWRRLAALEALRAETGDGRYDTVLALLRRPKDSSDAYVAMVEENEIRVGLSYYERARVAAEATKRGVYESEKQALLTLFANVSRAKRSRIRSFVRIYHALDGYMMFPAAIPERLGLAVAEFLKATPEGAKVLRSVLKMGGAGHAEAELALLAEAIRKPSVVKVSDVPRAEQLENGLKLVLKGKTITVSGKPVSDALFDKIRDALSTKSVGRTD